MASPVYEQILKVQALDLAIRQSLHQHANHPKREVVAGLETRQAETTRQEAELSTQVEVARKKQRELQADVEELEQKRKDIDAKLYGGTVNATKELLALQAEDATILERQRALEDDELVLMEELEAQAAKGEQLSEQLAELGREHEAATADLETELAAIDAHLAEARKQRDIEAAPANPDLLKRYEELRDSYEGVAVARLSNSHCDGCHMQLSAVAIDQIGKMPEDAVVTCEECGRLLVR